MARFIKAYNKQGTVVFELAVMAVNGSGAKARGTMSLLGRRPGMATGVVNIDVTKMPSAGIVNEYRVIIEIDNDENLRDKLKIDAAIEALGDIL